MRDGNTIIFDMTGEQALAGIVGDSPVGLTMVEEFAPDLRVAIGSVDGQINAWVRDPSVQIPEAVRPLVFDHLNECLPRIEDAELQSFIFAAFWRFLCDGLSERRLISREGRDRAYAIVQSHPAPALERFRAACASEERVPLVAFPNEAASLVIGAIESGEMRDSPAADPSVTAPVCLIVAYTDKRIEVCSFEHIVVDKGWHRIFIRDFFRTGISDINAELDDRHLSDDSRLAMLFESSNLSERSQKSLVWAVSGKTWEAVRSQRPLVDLRRLKMSGAAHLVCKTEYWSGPVQYEIGTAFHIGVRAQGERFQQVFTQQELMGAVRYPVTSSRVFRLYPRPANDVAIRAFCGYSNRIEESTVLGELTITRPEIDELFRHKQGALSALVTLESGGKGEFSLAILPSGRTIGSQTFMLPSLMV